MRRKLWILAVTAFVVLFFSPLAGAGLGVKYETSTSEDYSVGGLDLELGLPVVPVRPIFELVGVWNTDDFASSEVQAGAGARFYLGDGASGLFLEGKLRYLLPLQEGAEGESVIVAGVGYRIRPIIGGLDVYVSTSLQEVDFVPKLTVGARLGF